MSPDERLRAAYDRCLQLKRQLSFRQALNRPAVRSCLEGYANYLQAKEEDQWTQP